MAAPKLTKVCRKGTVRFVWRKMSPMRAYNSRILYKKGGGSKVEAAHLGVPRGKAVRDWQALRLSGQMVDDMFKGGNYTWVSKLGEKALENDVDDTSRAVDVVADPVLWQDTAKESAVPRSMVCRPNQQLFRCLMVPVIRETKKYPAR